VDAREVTREIRRLVWPTLREEGFEAFTGRNAWRYVGEAIDVVNFQSFSASLADSLGCTTFSFGVNVGVWLPPDAWEGLELKRDAQGRLRPEEYQCEPHRRHLTKSLAQPWFKPFSSDARRWLPSLRLHREGLEKVFRRDRHDRSDVWFVLADRSNLVECLDDALQVIRAEGLPWFAATRRERRAPARPLSAETEALRQALRRPP
jgi:hypothetical protein